MNPEIIKVIEKKADLLMKNVIHLYRMKIQIALYFVISFFIFSSCEKEELGNFTVFTEEVVKVRGGDALVLGRIISGSFIPLEDHGFQVSASEDFHTPMLISLGPTDRPGRFFGEISGLESGSKYFLRAFAGLNGEVYLGNTLEFETFNAALFDFVPKTQFAGEIVTITGRNFDENVEVFIGDQRSEILSLEFGSRISIRVPPDRGFAEEKLKVFTGGDTLVFDQVFRYVTGIYKKLNEGIPGFRLVDNIYFQQGDRFFAGLGMNVNRTPSNFLWEYLPQENGWKEMEFPGEVQRRSANSKTGYFGGGYTGLTNFPNDLNEAYWQFDGNNFVEIPPSPHAFASSFGFMVNGEFYVAGGTVGVGSVVYKYSPLEGIWKLRPNLPFDVNTGQVYFTHEKYLYWIDEEKQLHQYNLFTAAHRIVGEYPSPFIEDITDFGGTAIVIGDRAYIGLYNRARDFWQLDLNDFVWSRLNLFPGDREAINAGIFFKGEKIYFLRSLKFKDEMEFWELDINGFE
jgi:hypothetical protein